jgi:GTPase SAR1 family protein
MYCLLVAGQQGHGKSSLVGCLVNYRSLINAPDDRTRLVNIFTLRISAKESIPVYDVGGHESYNLTWHILNRNAKGNTVLIAHSLECTEYDLTFKWMNDSLLRSPNNSHKFVLTKADQVKNSVRHLYIEKFVRASYSYMLRQCQILEQKIIKQKNENKESVLKAFQNLGKELQKGEEGNAIFVTSCIDYNTVKQLRENIVQHMKLSYVQLPELAHQLYGDLGYLGLKNQSENKKTSTVEHQSFPITSTDTSSCSEEDGSSETTETTEIKTSNQTIATSAIVDTTSEITRDESKDNFERNKIILKPLNYVKFEKALAVLKELKKCEAITDDLRKELLEYLKLLHKNGLIIYYYNIPELQGYIFNNLGEFASMFKFLFRHDLTEYRYEEIDDSLKGPEYITKTSLNDDIEQLTSKGIMSNLIMKDICLKLKIHVKEFQALLKHLNMAYPIKHEHRNEEDPDMFFPWFIENKKTNKIQYAVDASKFLMKIEHLGIFPSPFFYNLVVLLFKRMFHKGSVSCLELNKNSIQYKGNVVLFLDIIKAEDTKEQNEKIVTYLQCSSDKKGIAQLWDTIKELNKAVNELIQEWWPGLIEDAYLVCTHCLLASDEDPQLVPLQKALQIKYENRTYCHEKEIPSVLHHPPGIKAYVLR